MSNRVKRRRFNPSLGVNPSFLMVLRITKSTQKCYVNMHVLHSFGTTSLSCSPYRTTKLFCTGTNLPFLCFSFHFSSRNPYVSDPFPSRHRNCADTAVACYCVRLVFPPYIQHSSFFIHYVLDNKYHLHASMELDKRSTKTTFSSFVFVKSENILFKTKNEFGFPLSNYSYMYLIRSVQNLVSIKICKYQMLLSHYDYLFILSNVT